MNVYEKLKELIEAALNANTQWTYSADLEAELKEFCAAADNLLEEGDSYAYELDIDDNTANLTLTVEDVYCELQTDKNSPLVKLIGFSESVSILPAKDQFFSINFRFKPVFKIN